MTLTTTPTARRRSATCASLLLSLGLLTGCFTLVDGRNYAIGTETTRANVVVHTVATKFLYGRGVAKGAGESRTILLAAIPDKIAISKPLRLAICGVSVALCLSADQIGRTLVSWFKSDIRTRGDFWESLRSAGRDGRCFAWTFTPSRNLTTKGVGTSGCKAGVLI